MTATLICLLGMYVATGRHAEGNDIAYMTSVRDLGLRDTVRMFSLMRIKQKKLIFVGKPALSGKNEICSSCHTQIICIFKTGA
jgi:hypothetical protein